MTTGIAITGIGCLGGGAHQLSHALAALMAGARDPRLSPRFVTAHDVPFPVFELATFQEPAHLTRTGALALVAADAALADAALDDQARSGLRVGVILGTSVGCTLSREITCRTLRAGEPVDLAPLRTIHASQPAALVARTFGLSGPCQVIVNACSSGTDALGMAAQWIREELCDVVLAGGAEELSRVTLNGFASMKIMDTRPCRPFDQDRRGLNLGEGAAVLVLESEASRRRRGVQARAWLSGFAAACDAHHQTAPHPEGEGLRRALGQAMSNAGIRPSDIAFVNAHGTGTQDNDRVESRVLADVLPGVPYHSTKGFTGHALGAAGAIEAALAIACLNEGVLPPSLGFETADPDLGPPPVRAITPLRGRFALSQSLAFGGNNAVVIFEQGDRP